MLEEQDAKKWQMFDQLEAEKAKNTDLMRELAAHQNADRVKLGYCKSLHHELEAEKDKVAKLREALEQIEHIYADAYDPSDDWRPKAMSDVAYAALQKPST